MDTGGLENKSRKKMARLALERARDRTQRMEERYMRDLRTEHVHQLYDHKGCFIPNDSVIRNERKMSKQYERLVERQKSVELMYTDLVLSQDLYHTRFTYVGEKLVDVVQRHKGIGMECACIQATGCFIWKTNCERCFIPANVLTTIALPSMVTQIVKHIYLVEYAKGGMAQLCAPEGVLINLSWNEAAAIAWCSYAGTLSKLLIANTKFGIPLGYRKKLVIDTTSDIYEVHGPAGACISLSSYENLAKLQTKCREFGFRSSEISKVMPFIPHFFHKI